MRINTEELYNDKYCERINAKEWRYRTIPPVMEILYNHFKPRSVVDVGCANGIHLRMLKDLGVPRLLGIEGTSSWTPYIERVFGGDYLIADLRDPLPKLKDKFELVISFEVLEHLEKAFARQAARNLTSLGDTLCISACPLEGGFHHLNPQPREYWIKIFEHLGFGYSGKEVEYLQNIFSTMRCSGWFKNSLKIFRRM